MIRNSFSQWLVIFGCFLINLPVGISRLYGNLSVYIDSYFKFQVGNDPLHIPSDWLLSALIVSSALGIMTVDWLVNKLTQHWTHIIAIFFFDFGLFLSYFACQHSVGFLLMSFIICGYSCGIIITVCFKYVTEAVPENLGTPSAIVSSSFGLGAFITNYVTTLYINPDDLTPDVHESNMAYFSQPKVLHHVPQVFLVIAVGTFVLHMLGYLLEQLPIRFMVSVEMSIPICTEFEGGNQNTSTKLLSQDMEIPIVFLSHDKEKTPIISFSQDNGLHQQSKIPSTADVENITDCLGTPNNKSVKEKRNYSTFAEDKQPLISQTLSEILKTKAFYLLWLAMAVLTYGSLIIMNYYKVFGLLYIADDSFLTSIGSFSALSDSLYRLATGVAMDKIGVKNTLILALSKNSILIMLWYITPQLNRWCYFFCCQMLSGTQGTFYCLLPVALLKLYGPEHFATDYGLTMTASVITGLISPVIFTFVLNSYGWFTLVLSGSSCSLFVLVATVCLMPRV